MARFTINRTFRSRKRGMCGALPLNNHDRERKGKHHRRRLRHVERSLGARSLGGQSIDRLAVRAKSGPTPAATIPRVTANQRRFSEPFGAPITAKLHTTKTKARRKQELIYAPHRHMQAARYAYKRARIALQTTPIHRVEPFIITTKKIRDRIQVKRNKSPPSNHNRSTT